MTIQADRLIGTVVAVAMVGVGALIAQAIKVVSPEVGTDRRVTFRVSAPTASTVEVVQLASSQGFGLPAMTLRMTRDGDMWTATSPALTPDIYAYRFRIDGKVVNDPANAEVIEETNTSYSKVAVPGALWTDTGAPVGTVTRHSYSSTIIGGDEPYLVYTPPRYEADRSEPYPTLYLLHGLGDSASSWIANGESILRSIICSPRVEPSPWSS